MVGRGCRPVFIISFVVMLSQVYTQVWTSNCVFLHIMYFAKCVAYHLCINKAAEKNKRTRPFCRLNGEWTVGERTGLEARSPNAVSTLGLGTASAPGAGRATGKKWTVLVIKCGPDSSPQQKWMGKGNFSPLWWIYKYTSGKLQRHEAIWRFGESWMWSWLSQFCSSAELVRTGAIWEQNWAWLWRGLQITRELTTL